MSSSDNSRFPAILGVAIAVMWAAAGAATIMIALAIFVWGDPMRGQVFNKITWLCAVGAVLFPVILACIGTSLVLSGAATFIVVTDKKESTKT